MVWYHGSSPSMVLKHLWSAVDVLHQWWNIAHVISKARGARIWINFKKWPEDVSLDLASAAPTIRNNQLQKPACCFKFSTEERKMCCQKN